jgi:xanthine dehydrogenase accessory factor
MTEAQPARLPGPVGLNIHAKTPAEIAVSIVAQIVAVKNTPAIENPSAANTSVRPEPVEGL